MIGDQLMLRHFSARLNPLPGTISSSSPAQYLMCGLTSQNSGYSTALLTFVFRDAKPEVLGISSYALGDAWSVGPIPLGLGVEAEIPVPFGNMAFEASGFVEEEMDFQVKRRRLGEVSGWYSGDTHSVHGEIVYQKNDALIIVSGKSSTAIYSGSHYNSPTVNSSSAKANYYITARKRY